MNLRNVLWCAAWLMAAGPCSGADRRFYVSPTGSDDAPGSAAAPFRTLGRAQSAARAAAEGMRGDVVVNLAAGDYRLDRTLELTEADSGRNGSALGMMTHLFAVRLADEGIQVFEVCPGVIESDMTAPVRQKYDRLIAEGLWPIRRWGQPDDVARAVAAIVGDSFPFTTGQRFDIDGGFHIRRL